MDTIVWVKLLKFRIQQGRAESPMEHIAQGKRSDTLGSRVLEQSRPVRAKALRHGASIEKIYIRCSTLKPLNQLSSKNNNIKG